MMKHLILVPFLFTLISCMPPKEKIEDRPGGCVNGHCTVGPETKPSECNGTAKFNTLSGVFQSPEVTVKESGVTYSSQFVFNKSEAQLTQFCEVKGTTEFESPTIASTFSVNKEVTQLKFDKPDALIKTSKSFKCKAELTADIFNLSVQGNCLVTQVGKDPAQYFVRTSP